jgi:hypothetical protein
MRTVTIKFKDGTMREFIERGRPGGSWSMTVRYEGLFVIVKNEWGLENAFPASDVVEVINTPGPSRY